MQKQWITHEIKRKVMLKSEGQCFHCGKKATKALINKRGLPELKDENNQTFQYDHLIPELDGGNSDESNIVISCEKCNKSRSRSTRKYQNKISEFIKTINN